MRRLAAFALAFAVAATFPAYGEDENVGAYRYRADFESAPGSEWSTTTRSKTPSGRSFLGEFTNRDAVTLTLTGLPPTSKVTVSFDLYVLKSWDGNNPATNAGPDLFDVTVAAGPSLMHSTFSNSSAKQSYPAEYPKEQHAARTGAAETNTLGYPSALGGDSVYRVSVPFEWTGPAVVLRFAANGGGPARLDDESWGIDNVDITAQTSCGTLCVVTTYDSKITDLTMSEPGEAKAVTVSLEFGAVKVETGGWYVEQSILVPRSALLPAPETLGQSVGGVNVSYATRQLFCVQSDVCSFGFGSTGSSTSKTVAELWNGRIQIWANGAKVSDLPAVVVRQTA